MKYRIIQRSDGRYIGQYKSWLFWHTFDRWIGDWDAYADMEFNDIRSVLEHIKQEIEKKHREKKMSKEKPIIVWKHEATLD